MNKLRPRETKARDNDTVNKRTRLCVTWNILKSLICICTHGAYKGSATLHSYLLLSVLLFFFRVVLDFSQKRSSRDGLYKLPRFGAHVHVFINSVNMQACV